MFFGVFWVILGVLAFRVSGLGFRRLLGGLGGFGFCDLLVCVFCLWFWVGVWFCGVFGTFNCLMFDWGVWGLISF